ncbi:MAG: hypothetical protein HON70_35055 [Lentisphaerae bacterium]|nr:hypothetical protein [Lentisphaerota bacterium]
MGREEGAWIVQAHLPWDVLPCREALMSGGCRFQISRFRSKTGELLQWSPTAGKNQVDRLDLFGTLTGTADR